MTQYWTPQLFSVAWFGKLLVYTDLHPVHLPIIFLIVPEFRVEEIHPGSEISTRCVAIIIIIGGYFSCLLRQIIIYSIIIVCAPTYSQV